LFGKKKETRFEILLEDRLELGSVVGIYRDKQTGVQYMFAWANTGGGLTPLLDKDGKPIIDDTTK